MKNEPNKFLHPTEIDDIMLAFPANIKDLVPRYDDIPKDYHHGLTKWNRFQGDWFYAGITKDKLVAKKGVDLKTALRHLSAVQGSFELKHEHKEAAVAYLASLWLDESSTWQTKR